LQASFFARAAPIPLEAPTIKARRRGLRGVEEGKSGCFTGTGPPIKSLFLSGIYLIMIRASQHYFTLYMPK
jgi:hypothetical protein